MFTPLATPPTLKMGIYRSSSIGDVVLATACLSVIEKLRVPVELRWIGRGPSLQLISKAYPEIKPIEVNPNLPQYQEQVVKQLEGLHFILDLQKSFRSRAITRMAFRQHQTAIYSWEKNSTARSRMVFSARLRGRRQSLPEHLQSSKHRQFKAMLEALKRSLRQHLPVESLYDLDHFEACPSLPNQHDHGQRPWQKELKFGTWLAIAPGAAHPTKKAPESLYLDVLARIRQNLDGEGVTNSTSGLGLLFVGNEADREEALSMTDQLGWQGPVLNLAGKLSLWESALALREAQLVVCNDSSLSHIAEAVGTPAVVLFGPTVEAFGFDPWRTQSKAFSSPLGCRPCSKHGKPSCRFGDKLCFKLLSSATIAGYCLQIIKPAMQDSVGNGQ